MASQRFPRSLFSRKRNRSNVARTQLVGRHAMIERLEDRQLLAVVGAPAAELASSADGYVDRLYSDWLAYEAGGSQGSFAASQSSLLQFSGNAVAVKILAPHDTTGVASTLESLGMTSVHSTGANIGGWAPVANLPAITAAEGVEYVSLSLTPIFRAGNAQTQGDEALRSDEVRSDANLGQTGAGVNVGIISDSFNVNGIDLSNDITNGDLPNVTVLQDDLGTSSGFADDEGRAMAEVIHDVAPDASLFFHNVNRGGTGLQDEGTMVTAIENLDTAGVNVIVDDVYFPQEPFFQDGIVAQKINEVASRGTDPITYLSAAGNSGDSSYEATYVDSGIVANSTIGANGPNQWHDFDPTAGVAPLQTITIPFGSTVSIVFQYDVPFRSLRGTNPSDPSNPATNTPDFNTILIDPTQLDGGNAFDPATSAANHSGVLAQGNANRFADEDPLEFFSYTNNDPTNDQFQFGILRSGNTATPRLKYVLTQTQGTGQPSIDDFQTFSSTLTGHANAEGAIAVGAAFYNNTTEFNSSDPQVSESSAKGGTPILFDSNGNVAPETRSQPVIIGPDGGNNTFFGQDIPQDTDSQPNFFGTSAAAAHIAGVVALMLEADPNQTPTQNRDILVDTAIDVLERVTVNEANPVPGSVVTPGASVGVDDYSGAGFVDAKAAVQASLGIPLIDLDSATAGNNSAGTFDEQAGTPVSITGMVTIADPDDTMLARATVTITDLADNPNEILDVDLTGTSITKSYDTATGVLTLTGPAPLGDFETVLSTLTYDLNSISPTGTSRTVEVLISTSATVPAPANTFATANAVVTIDPFNDPPTANDDPNAGTFQTDEDTLLNFDPSRNVLGNDTDPENDTLTAVVVTQPSNGTLILMADGTFSYDPNLDFNGTDSFTYAANDGGADSAPATVRITVNPVNDAPIGTADNHVVNEDETLTVNSTIGVLNNDSDVDNLNSELSVSLFGPAPAGQSFTLNSDGSFTFQPVANFNGQVSFQYIVTDGTTPSPDPTTVTIDVLPVNDRPTADANTVNAVEDTDFNGTLTGSDVESATLIFAISTPVPAAEGTVTITDINSGAFTFDPADDFNGTTSFQFTVEDESGLVSLPATITVNVAAANDAPVADDANETTAEETAFSGTLVANDIDTGDMLTFSIGSVTPAAAGTVVLDNPATGAYTFTPATDFNGSASFTFTANDSTVDSNTATVTFDVTAVNDPPVADPLTVGTIEDTPVSGTVTATDVDSGTFTFTVVDNVPAAAGTLSFDGSTGNFTYTPAANFNGATSFTFTANDGQANSANTATVTINVADQNDPPEADDANETTMEDTPLTAALTGSDNDGNPLTFAIADDSSLAGTVVITNPNTGAYTFTPTAEFSGTTSFTFVANDTFVDSAPATVTIEVLAVNDDPVADNDTLLTDEDTPNTIDPRSNDTDIDSPTLTITGVSTATNGTVTFTGTSVTYDPNLNFNGADSFTYTISDGNGGTDVGTVNVTVGPVNDPPQFTSTPITMGQENSLYSYTITASDVDDPADELGIVANTLPAWLTLTDNLDGTATLTGTPAMADIGPHTVVLTVSDPGSASDTQSFTITVLADNVPPTADDDSFTVDEDVIEAPLAVLANDTTAPDTGETITITGVSGVALGHSVSLSGSPGSQVLLYSPPSNYFGTTSFTYTINDGTPGSSDTATVTVTVNEVNDPPTANDDTFFGIAEDSVDNQLDVLVNDTFLPDVNETLSIVNVTAPDQGGTVEIDDNGTPADPTDDTFLNYSPAVGFRGTETFMYTITDGRGLTATATVNIAVFNEPVFQVASTGDVFAIGSDDSDNILFVPASFPNSIIVRYNERVFGPYILQPDSTLNADGRGGSDVIILAGGSDRISIFEGGTGNDYIASGTGDDTLSGGVGNDRLLAGEGDNVVFGGSEHDHLDARSGNDTLDGGAGNDYIYGQYGDDVIYGGADADEISGGHGNDLIFGGQGDDVLTGEYGDDVIVGGDGSDLIFGRNGNDVLIGGLGADHVRGDNGEDIILGGSSDYDTDEQALLAILAEWTSSGTFSQRMMNIESGATTGGNPFSSTTGTTNDASPDALVGGTDADWFLGFNDYARDNRIGEDVLD